MSKIKQMIARMIGVELPAVAAAAAPQRMAAAAGSDLSADIGRQEDIGWRRLSMSVAGELYRELPPITQDEMIRTSYWAWKTNPLLNWLIEITVAFVVGDGIKLKAKSGNEDVQAVLDDFWSHPVNNMDLYLPKFVRELGIYGEQCWPKFVGYYGGKVALGYQDPMFIKRVITDPENCKIVIGVITLGVDFRDGKKYKTALDPEVEDFLSPDAKAFRDSCGSNECYFFSINNVTNAVRGTSDLFVVLDWGDQYEQFLFDYSEKISQFNTYVWDLMVKGADDSKIKELVNQLTKKSGSVFSHNDQVTLEAKTPDFKAGDNSEASRTMRNHIMRHFPEHWFGGGGDVNRAAAMEMGTPVFKMLSARQKYVAYMLEQVGNDVIREAVAHGTLKAEEKDLKCRAEMPEMVVKDLTRFGTIIQGLSASLVSMTQGEMVSKDSAIKIFAFTLSMLGYELDPESEKEAIAQDLENQKTQDYVGQPGPVLQPGAPVPPGAPPAGTDS